MKTNFKVFALSALFALAFVLGFTVVETSAQCNTSATTISGNVSEIDGLTSGYGVQVQAIDPTTYMVVASDMTSQNGSYTITGLTPCNYYLLMVSNVFSRFDYFYVSTDPTPNTIRYNAQAGMVVDWLATEDCGETNNQLSARFLIFYDQVYANGFAALVKVAGGKHDYTQVIISEGSNMVATTSSGLPLFRCTAYDITYSSAERTDTSFPLSLFPSPQTFQVNTGLQLTPVEFELVEQ